MISPAKPRRLGRLVMSMELLRGMLNIGGEVVEVSQSEGERRMGAVMLTIESEELDEVEAGATPPIVHLEDVQE